MKPRASTLFHFTKSSDTLFKILKTGFWPRYCFEDIGWQGFNEAKFIAFPMVCFCDIPLSRISEHVSYYGSYGIGLGQEWGVKNNLNPVIYLSPEGHLAQSMKDSMDYAISTPEGDDKTPIDNFRHIISHVKPICGKVATSDGFEDKEFYQESEWRYIPKDENIHSHVRCDPHNSQHHIDAADEKTKEHCMLRFAQNDISFIFVPEIKDIPDVISFIETEISDLTEAEKKVMYSKVISIESIIRDL